MTRPFRSGRPVWFDLGMKRTFAALLIPAALLLASCSGEPEKVSAPATSTMNVLDSLALPTDTNAPRATTTVKATMAQPTTIRELKVTVEDVETVSADPPSESQMCRDLLEMMDQFPGLDADGRSDGIRKLRADSMASADWKSKSASEKASMDRAFNAAMSGTC